MSKIWNCESEVSLRRFNPRGNPYQISHDRYANHNSHRESSRNYALSSHDTSNNDYDADQDSSKNSRRRIPVACVRCRKRKIKCSGSAKSGGSCTNCENAGVENCQFNRVTSEPVQWRESNATVDFTYDIGMASQAQAQCRIPHSSIYSGHSSYSAPNLVPLSLYRSPGIPGYHYSGKQSSYLQSYGTDYGDDAVDYSLSGGSYSLLGQEHVNVPPSSYNGPNSSRWPSTPQKPNSALYFDSDNGSPSYHAQMTFPSHGYSMRPSISAEPNSFSFSSMASSLPTPSPNTSNDRMLPMPASNRGANLVALSRTAENISYSAQPAQSASKGAPAGGSMYLPLSSSPDSEGLNSYDSHQQSEPYGSSSSDGWQETSTPSLRSHHSNSDLYYPSRSSDGNARKQSHSSQSSSSAGMLSNGQAYVLPFDGPAPLSRHPSLDLTHVASHRPSNSSLRA